MNASTTPERETAVGGQPATRAVCTMAAADASVPALRRFAREAGRRWAVPGDGVEALALVVSELVTNVVLHSGSADVTVLVSHDGDTLTVQVRDAGRWQCRSVPRRAPEDADAVCGRGLGLVRQLSEWFSAFPSPTGTRVVARLPLPRDAECNQPWQQPA
jgi:anti-sigma regulatory factor (Ser/Thr protein kinase)